MYGFFYSVKQNYRFERKEWLGLFWTSLAFGFVLSFRKWGSGSTVDVGTGISNLLLATVLVLLAMFVHVSIQKIVAIKLGYKATYSHWVNGILISVFLGFLSFGYLVFILPGSIIMQHTPGIRLGKFRYSMNLKDLARVSVAGPLSHIFLIMITGSFYLMTGGTSDILFGFMFINMLLAFYSCLPIPKIDMPTKTDAGSDGLGLFFFSRTIYIFTIVLIITFIALVYVSAATTPPVGWPFVLSLIIGLAMAIFYSLSLEQK